MARRPERLGDFVGQPLLIRRVRKLVEGSRSAGEPCPPLLLVGPAGAGKTTLARALAKELGSVLHERTARPDVGAAEVVAVLLQLKHGDVLFIDEGQALRRVAQEVLYRAIDEQKVPRLTDGKLDWNERVSVAQFTLVLGTNEPHRLRPALQSRLLRLEFAPYAPAALKEIAEQTAKGCGVCLTPQAANYLARRLIPPTARAVDLLLKETLRFHAGVREIGIMEVRQFLHDHLELDASGLGPTHRRFLQALKESDQGRCSLRRLSAVLFLSEADLETALEPPLLALGLVEAVAGVGRVLTTKGALALEEFAARNGKAVTPVQQEEPVS